MRLWPLRARRPEPPRPDPLRIAVLEHELLGIEPKPGTAAALTIALRRVGSCFEHDPVETSGLGDARRNGLCSRCGSSMVIDDAGDWVVATAGK